MDMTPQTWPDWYDGRHINEAVSYTHLSNNSAIFACVSHKFS